MFGQAQWFIALAAAGTPVFLLLLLWGKPAAPDALSRGRLHRRRPPGAHPVRDGRDPRGRGLRPGGDPAPARLRPELATVCARTLAFVAIAAAVVGLAQLGALLVQLTTLADGGPWPLATRARPSSSR